MRLAATGRETLLPSKRTCLFVSDREAKTQSRGRAGLSRIQPLFPNLFECKSPSGPPCLIVILENARLCRTGGLNGHRGRRTPRKPAKVTWYKDSFRKVLPSLKVPTPPELNTFALVNPIKAENRVRERNVLGSDPRTVFALNRLLKRVSYPWYKGLASGPQSPTVHRTPLREWMPRYV